MVADWCARWKSAAPGSNPERALQLAPFLGALHGAATYAHFLSQIEETEWSYHGHDVPRCLKAAEDVGGALLLWPCYPDF